MLYDNQWLHRNISFEHFLPESQNKFIFPISLEHVSLMLYHKCTSHIAKYI